MTADYASVVEGIGWCLSTYVSMPLGQKIVGSALALVAALAVFYLHSENHRRKAKALQAIVVSFSALSVVVGASMGHPMPEMEFLFVWLPLSAWVGAAGVYFLNHLLYTKAFNAFPAPAAMQEKINRLAEEAGLSKKPLLLVSNASGLELLSSFGKTSVVIISATALEALEEKELEAGLFHEMVHLKNEDSLFKLYALAGLLTVFAPVIWAIRRLAVWEQEASANALTALHYPNEFYSASKKFFEKR